MPYWELFACFCCCVFAVIAGFAALAQTSEQNVRVIEVTAKKYEYTPFPLRVRRGTQVQLKITSLDKTHGFKINLYRRIGRER
jgi:heme/copper-type cytochrome/quinol oxidase subunit 2